ncbi:hypothetical protein D9619_011824 [Psilocybe cf. subviscida]|uniref:Cysteine-rich protein 1 n=1 Tax=Psilocybe cf. subviscida TaxID=2480587 RepID=A0A8H5B095_9AGAR|nr:hypothetical protein D9619_011824 [Psilocybe cf. subviscida]
MHPFGGTPICPRCSKAVYAAEQTMGPGRKLYHKPCLACMSCNKRLDSYTLLEHDEQPYCKACHLKNFGTRNLRHANLPVAVPPSPTSPPSSTPRRMSTGNDLPRLRANRSLASSPVSSNFPRGISPHQNDAGSTKRGSWGSARGSVTPPEEVEVRKALTLEEDDVMDTAQTPPPASKPLDGLHYSDDTVSAEPQSQSQYSQPSHTGRPGIGTIPRTIPLNIRHRTSSSLNSLGTIPQESEKHEEGQAPSDIDDDDDDAADAHVQAEAEADDVTPSNLPPPSLPRRPSPTSPNAPTSPSALARHYTGTAGASPSSPRGFAVPPILKPTATGTRYGMALGGSSIDSISVQTTGSPRRQWGAGTATPQCPRCGKSVYFAEQVKAVGKTFHKACLRCTECNTTLDSNRLRDHDGDPYCVRCYGKNYGPQGSGYALLGKAGG